MNNPLDLEAIKREYPHIAQGGNIPTLDLDAIRKRAESATAGPWTTSGPDTIGQWVIYDSEWAVAHAAAYDHNNVLSDRPGARGPAYIDSDANAEFIAHARTDVPALVAEVERLRAEVMIAEARGHAAGYNKGYANANREWQTAGDGRGMV